MALTVEDGSNVTGADSYDTLAAFVAWETTYYGEASSGTDTVKEAAIRRAVVYLNWLRWKGTRANDRDQPLAWPREDATDGEGNEVAETEIPDEVIFAQHRLARAELLTPGILDAEFTSGSVVKREKVGPIEVEYARPAGSADDARAEVLMALDVIAGLLAGRPGSGTKFLARA